VDDAVMLALKEEAENYAPTLLEVAKLALHRPLATLGLVGILESRSSLRQRIERLLDFRPPRKAGLTLGSALAVLGFAALAVPMAEAPPPRAIPESAASLAATNTSAINALPNPGAPTEQRVKASMLVHDGKLLYEMGKLDEAKAKLTQAIKMDPQNEAARYYLNVVAEAKFSANPVKRELLPVPKPNTNAIHIGQGRPAIMSKLDRIRLDRVSFDGLPLIEVVRFLSDESRKRDPEKQGINFLVNQSIDSSSTGTAATLGPDGQPRPTAPAEQVDIGAVVIKINPPLTNMRLADVLDAIVKVADRPIKYSIEDYAIVFSPKGHETTPLYTRTFKVDPSAMLDALHLAKDYLGTNGPGAIGPALLDFLAKAGVDLDPRKNPGNAFFYSERNGMLLVRGTLQDLDIIEQMLGVLNTTPPQVNIKVKFVEISQDDSKASGFDWYLGNVLLNTNSTGGQAGVAPSYSGAPTAANPLGAFPGNPFAGTAIAPGPNAQPLTSGLRSGGDQPFTLTGILTDPQYRMVIKALQQRKGAKFLSEPNITTLNGRQAQCKVMSIQTVVKGINPRALTPPGITSTNDDVSAAFESKAMEFGTIFDVVPTVSQDGYTINLPVDVTVLGFAGYDDPGTNRVAVYLNGDQKWVAPPQPKLQKREVAATVNVWDGQTLVLGGLIAAGDSNSAEKRNLLIFVTPTIIDQAGNRVHTDDEMPFSRNGIPQQPAR
jgi:general secretion pathway protein D